ncbi:MAG: hypothetical protein RL100_529 [Actinomycetota bacterium]|jgi:predicted dehydrogenase
MTISKLNWGFLGTGWIADFCARDLDFTNISKYGVTARDFNKAEEFAKSHGFKKSYVDFEAMLTDPEIHAVYIATLNQVHFEHALAALGAGKHVLLEKPFTINARQSKELIEFAKEKNLFLMEAMWVNHLPAQQAIENILAQGMIGEIQTASADLSLYQLEQDGYGRMWHVSSGGGTLLDLGIYPLHFVYRLLGKMPISITATAQLTGLAGSADRVDEDVSATLQFESRKTGIIHSRMSATGRNIATILGSKGRIELPREWWQATSFTVLNHVNKVIFEYHQPIDGSGRQFQFLEAERCIEAGFIESPNMSLEDTLSVMESMDEIRRQIGVKYQWD